MQPVQFFKCLADETRLRCLLLITQEQELCVCELMTALQESQPKISRHLAQLRECGLLEDRRQGQWVFYKLHTTLPDWASNILKDTLRANETLLKNDNRRLKKMGERPVRLQSCC